MAERVGFEPTDGFRRHTLSKRAPSAARPPLLIINLSTPQFLTLAELKNSPDEQSIESEPSEESIEAQDEDVSLDNLKDEEIASEEQKDSETTNS